MDSTIASSLSSSAATGKYETPLRGHCVVPAGNYPQLASMCL
jgi:hypothetical protein